MENAPSIKLDNLDILLLRRMSSEPNLSIRRLALEISVPPSTLYDRLKKLEDNGIIKGRMLLLNEEKLGFTVKALILVNVDGKHIVEVEEEIAKDPRVQVVLDITGEFDIAVIGVFRSIGELDHFVKNLLRNPHIKQTRTSIAFRTIKQNYSLGL
jgi:Lrp/AsnC family transcriptional regulator for asnA, asnC and gidA